LAAEKAIMYQLQKAKRCDMMMFLPRRRRGRSERKVIFEN
jgi:hypothetical protein